MSFKISDKVKYKASFLKSVGWYTDVPNFGIVSAVDGEVLSIHWEGRDQSISVRQENVMPFDKPDYSGM